MMDVFKYSYLFLMLRWSKMLKSRGIKRGVEVFVKDPVNPDDPLRKARVVNTYPHPSNWLVVQYENGEMKEVDGDMVTTMFEQNRQRFLP
jgi:hypothetical protein